MASLDYKDVGNEWYEHLITLGLVRSPYDDTADTDLPLAYYAPTDENAPAGAPDPDELGVGATVFIDLDDHDDPDYGEEFMLLPNYIVVVRSLDEPYAKELATKLSLTVNGWPGKWNWDMNTIRVSRSRVSRQVQSATTGEQGEGFIYTFIAHFEVRRASLGMPNYI